MKEVYEFRLFEREAQEHLAADVGIRHGLARVVVTSRGDQVFRAVGNAQRKLIRRGDRLIASWNVRRTYTSPELARAEAFRLLVTSTFEPSGEECGTEFDDSLSCDICGVGRLQTSVLRLEGSRIPRTDFSNTIAREVIVTSGTASKLEALGASGVDFGAIQSCGGASVQLDDWRQVRVTGPTVRVASRTKWGHTPFDAEPAGSEICARGHVRGVNVLSEVFLDRSTWTGADFAVTQEHEGIPMGLIRPWPIVIISRRAWLWLREIAATGWAAEIAHIS